jgi:CRP/FNR family transcriptional regulator, anaerobic regulatory protein
MWCIVAAEGMIMVRAQTSEASMLVTSELETQIELTKQIHPNQPDDHMNIPETFRNIFEPELLRELEGKGKILQVAAGGAILSMGQIVKQIPLIVEGTVKVSRMDEDGRELLLYYVNPNESCAMTFTCCMQQFPSEIQAVAEDDVTILAVPVSVMDEWLVKYPTWKAFVMRTIRARFNEMLKTIDQITFQKLDERLIRYLKDKTTMTRSAVINLSHQQIADELATSRVVISRLLKKLENDKKVILFRNQIKVIKEL